MIALKRVNSTSLNIKKVMKKEYFMGDPLKGTRWENLTLYEYYEEMSDDERKELKEYLESINAPFTCQIEDEEECYPKECDKTWRDIVSMSNKELKEYYCYILHMEELHRMNMVLDELVDFEIHDITEEEWIELKKDENNYVDGLFLPF